MIMICKAIDTTSGADGTRTRGLLRDRKVPPVATFVKMSENHAVLPKAPFDFGFPTGAVECIVERNFSNAFEREGLCLQEEERSVLSWKDARW